MFNSGLLKGTTIRMGDGTLKNVEDIQIGDTVQSYSTGEGFDNAHLRFNKVTHAEVVSIKSKKVPRVVKTTFDDFSSLVTTFEYPYNMQHTSASACAEPLTHGICYHASWESYRPDLTFNYYGAGPSGSEHFTPMEHLGVGDQVWEDAGKHPKSHKNDGEDWWNQWDEPEVHVFKFEELEGDFDVYVFEDLKNGSVVWANGKLVAAGDSFTYGNPDKNTLTGTEYEKRKHFEKLGTSFDKELTEKLVAAHSITGGWEADAGDILEHLENISGSNWQLEYNESVKRLKSVDTLKKLT
ncbi:MAG: hypothetical protein H8E03_00870 [Pelagibacteraceae bacterium]|nr:hypothetical protein [Pelagibacteraceae bacterium]